MLRPEGGEPWGLSAPPRGGRALGTKCSALSFLSDISWKRLITQTNSQGAIHSTRSPPGPTRKSGPKLSRLDRTDPLSFGPKFSEILVEWIAPLWDRSSERKSTGSLVHNALWEDIHPRNVKSRWRRMSV